MRGKADKPRALLCKPSRDEDSRKLRALLCKPSRDEDSRKLRALLCKPSRDEDSRKLILSVMLDQGRQRRLRIQTGIVMQNKVVMRIQAN